MSERIREIQAFYEADGRYAVPEVQARFLLESAVELAMEHTYASVAIKSLEAVMPLTDAKGAVRSQDPVEGSHTALFTRRLFEGSDGQVRARKLGISSLLISPSSKNKLVYGSSFLVRVNGKNRQGDSQAIATTIHELAHTFNMDHCQQPAPVCVMKKGHLAGVPERETLSPFCYVCTSDFRGLTNLYLCNTDIS